MPIGAAVRTGRAALTLAGVALVADLAAAPAGRSPRSGLDIAAFDRSVRPQDDLFRFVNGGWLARTEIPPDQVSYGTFSELTDGAAAELRRIIEQTADGRHPRGSPEQQVGDLYRSLMDEARLEARGEAPIRADLARIDAITTTSDLATEAGRLSAIAAGGPFDASVTTDPVDAGKLVVAVVQGGTLLPDRDYYLNDDARLVAIRAAYDAYLTTIFTLAGRPAPAADARAVVALETEIARIQSTRVESQAATMSNRFALADLTRVAPGFDWLRWAQPQGIHRVPTVILAQPVFFARFAAMVPTTPLSTWKAWLAARCITASAPYLSAAFDTARFEFFGRVLTGQAAPIPRWRRGVSLVNAYLGDAVGRLYVEKHFPQAAMSRMQQLMANMLAAFRQSIGELEWMAPATKHAALNKLGALWVKIGYPQRWRTYPGLEIEAGDLLGNVRRAQTFESERRRIARIRPLDRLAWPIPPQTVNALYDRAQNEIVLPAAILQPPLFDVGADDAVNYGGIGAIIGHEISHGLDDDGRYVDGAGAVGDWWSPGDVEEFRRRARRLADQFGAYSPVPGAKVNGELTLVENLGDLGGLSIAYRAYKLSLAGRRPPVIDGFTGEQRFFMAWARVWRTKAREAYLRQSLLSTPYAPAELRVNGIVSHVDGFYDAFKVKRGDALFRAPDARVRIW